MNWKILAVFLSFPLGLATPVEAAPHSSIPSCQLACEGSPLNSQEIILSQNTASYSSISLGQAADLINQWLEAKYRIFAPPFDRQSLAKFTTGMLYQDTLKAINYLAENDSYYEYGVQKVDAVEQFAIHANKATIEVRVTEDSTLYQGGVVADSSFNTKRIRYQLEYRGDAWKITDFQIMN